MSDNTMTTAEAARILQAEPQATNQAVAAAFTALNTANHIYNELPAFGPAQILPDLDAEMRAFKVRMQGRDQAEGYILAVEAEQHFTTRLREAEAMREKAAKARFDFHAKLRHDQIMAGRERAWREEHAKAIKNACREHADAVQAILVGVDSATTEEDLDVAVGHLAAEFHSRMKIINATRNHRNKKN